MRRRGWVIAVVVLSLLVLIIVLVASVADEPLRRYVEEQANSLLPGFHVTIGTLDLHPLTLSADLRDVVVRQDIHPDPPVLSIPHRHRRCAAGPPVLRTGRRRSSYRDAGNRHQ